MPGKLVHFEVPADDTRRALAFYGQLLGWSFRDMEGPIEYHMTQLSEDMAGAIPRRPGRRYPRDLRLLRRRRHHRERATCA